MFDANGDVRNPTIRKSWINQKFGRKLWIFSVPENIFTLVNVLINWILGKRNFKLILEKEFSALCVDKKTINIDRGVGSDTERREKR